MSQASNTPIPDKPLISVIMASYNHARFIGQAIESIVQQTYNHWELLVIDDGSTDESPTIIADYIRDKRIRLFFHEHKRNKGLPETLKRGLAQAKGDYVAFLESDDLWRENALQERLKALRKTRCRAVFNDVELLPMPGARTEWYDSYLARLAAEHEAALSSKPGADNLGLNLRYALLLENKIPTFSCTMLETKLLRSISLDSLVARWMDWYLWTQASQTSTFAYVPQKLTIWRLHTSSYNHSINIKTYLDDSRHIWRGFRRLARSGAEKTPLAYRMLLALPFWCRIFGRLFHAVWGAGLKSGIRAIKLRLWG